MPKFIWSIIELLVLFNWKYKIELLKSIPFLQMQNIWILTFFFPFFGPCYQAKDLLV